MYNFELVLVLLVAVTVLVMAARKIGIPYPILLTLGGLALGFMPGLPRVTIEPELIFLIFLPPLLQSAAYFTSVRDLRANLRSISLLAVGLPLFQTIVVGAVAHTVIPDLPWAAALVLGAIVSPPDALAITAVASRFSIPRRVITVLEGESLVNDATSLVAYRVALAAVVSGTFVAWEAGLSFIITGAGGVLIGLAAGWLMVWLIKHLNDAPVEILISLLAGFATYLLAENLHVSGVLAVVTMGVYLGRRGSHNLSPDTRLQMVAVWNMVVFLLNGFVFILIGLQWQMIAADLSSYSIGTLLGYAVLISVTVVVARIVWVWPAAYGPRWIFSRMRERDPYPPWQQVALVSWSGMRGIVSLAAALSLPLTTDSGDPFPQRPLIIFLTFCVILATLVLQGLSLPLVIRWLKLQDDGSAEREENKAWLHAIKAGAARLDELAVEEWASVEMVDDLRSHYEVKRNRFRERFTGDGDGSSELQLASYRRLRLEMLLSERGAILDLRDRGVINDEVMRRVEYELDLEEQRLSG